MIKHFKQHWYQYSFLIFFSLLLGCGGLVKLKLPESEALDPDKEWLTLGRNAQHQHYSNHNIAPPLEVVWKKGVKSVVTDHPLALGDYIIAPTESGILYMIDYNTGEKIASGKLGHALAASPTIHKNMVMYTGLEMGEKTLMGFNLQRAKRLWDEPYPHISTTPLVDGERIYFGTNRNRVFGADIETGEKIWEYKTNAAVQSSPAQQSGFLVFGDNHGWLYGLDAESGEEKWKVQLEGGIFSHPVLDDLLVYIGTVSGKMHAISLYTGETIWEKAFAGAIFSSPALYNNVLYIGNNAHEVIAMHKETGDIIWKFKTKGIVNTVPLPSPDYLYVSSWDRHLYVLNRFSGEMIFKQQFKRPIKSSPIIYRDYLIVQTANDKLYALANEKILQARRDEE